MPCLYESNCLLDLAVYRIWMCLFIASEILFYMPQKSVKECSVNFGYSIMEENVIPLILVGLYSFRCNIKEECVN